MSAANAIDDLDDIHERVRTRLAALDHRYTTGRRHLVELLARAGRPLTMPELLAMDRDLPQSSVYRNLEVLERTELVRRLNTGSDHACYELAEPILGHHHHLICVDCGTVTDIHLDDGFEQRIDDELASVAAANGYTPLGHSLDLHARCPDCA
ncbi:MAG: transcriptional repressor [Acidimicrobiia bacterium]|nr:transcriptional repressor [Acidimicrobiia bacterium]